MFRPGRKNRHGHRRLPCTEDRRQYGRELSSVERRALKVVSKAKRVTIGAIGAALETPPSTTTWIVSQLVEREIFKRTRDTKDRRKVWIELAGKGDALARLMERIPDRIAADLLYKVDDDAHDYKSEQRHHYPHGRFYRRALCPDRIVSPSAQTEPRSTMSQVR